MRRDSPVFLIGHGVRHAGGVPLAEKILALNAPVLTSWQAADLVDSDHPNFFGRPGVYGQRCANRVLYNASDVYLIGCRASKFTIGHEGWRPGQRVEMLDIDEDEGAGVDAFIHADASKAPELFSDVRASKAWYDQCIEWRARYAWFEASHVGPGLKLNAYEVVEAASHYFKPNEIVVTDMGVALCAAHQVVKLKPPQRLLTSGGLGEMGCGLPAAVGASFASGYGPVTCLHCDGGMMFNLQELQTIRHHRLPIKILVLDNDGYVMIKSTQRNLGIDYTGVSPTTGVSVPNLAQVALSMGIAAMTCLGRNNLKSSLDWLFSDHPLPQLLVVKTDPDQEFSPKLQPIREGNNLRSPTFEELSP